MKPLPVPEAILTEILESEYDRLGLATVDEQTLPAGSAYWPDYCTDSPGYHGPLVVLVWPSSPGAMSSFILQDGRWVHCNTSAW